MALYSTRKKEEEFLERESQGEQVFSPYISDSLKISLNLIWQDDSPPLRLRCDSRRQPLPLRAPLPVSAASADRGMIGRVRETLGLSVEPRGPVTHQMVMRCKLSLVSSLLGIVVVSGCGTDLDTGSESAETSRQSPAVASTPTTEPVPQEAASRGDWACAPNKVSTFFTDPVVYPVGMSIEEVAAKLNVASFDITDETSRSALVTISNERGLVVSRNLFLRSKSSGWALDRGRTC